MIERVFREKAIRKVIMIALAELSREYRRWSSIFYLNVQIFSYFGFALSCGHEENKRWRLFYLNFVWCRKNLRTLKWEILSFSWHVFERNYHFFLALDNYTWNRHFLKKETIEVGFVFSKDTMFYESVICITNFVLR